MTETCVALLEDDAELRALIARGLGEDGFVVVVAATATDFLRLLPQHSPDVLIVDIGLSDADGRDVVQALRARGVATPVIFLTARDAVPDRLAGFAAGGDDYLTKPFVFAELAARVRALARRGATGTVIDPTALQLDPTDRSASCGDARVDLSPIEFRILAALAAGQGKAVRRRELQAAAWPHGAIVHDNTLDVYIARLRRKLTQLPGSPIVVTIVGTGYALR